MRRDWSMAAEKRAIRGGVTVAIVGPTASGKSALALGVAAEMGPSTIFSMDAFQVYRGLDIGTGKIPLPERRGIPHYLLDIADPEQDYSVADYLRDAAAIRADVDDEDRGGSAGRIWVGGTGLYFRALREGINEIPATEPAIRQELEAMAPEERIREIREVDPRWAEKADLQNPRRVVRALAVYRQTGQPLSEWQSTPARPLLTFDRVFYLDWPDTDLKQRITRRVGEMWEAGWPEEVRRLMGRENWIGSSSARAIGYREIVAHLQGKFSREECLESITRRTWQYARRQRTWFRRETGLIALDAGAGAEAVTRAVVEGLA